MNNRAKTFFIISRFGIHTNSVLKEVYLEIRKPEDYSFIPTIVSHCNIHKATLFEDRNVAELAIKQLISRGLSVNSLYSIKEIITDEDTAKDKIWRT